MKKLVTLCMALLAYVATQAEEKTVWEGTEAISWNTEVAPGTQFETPEGIFAGLKKDNVIRVYTTTTYDDPQYVLTYKKGDSWDWTDLETSLADGIISYTVADETTATEISERGLILRGQAWTATKITITTGDDVVTPEPEVTYEATELWTGSKASGDWDGTNGVVALSYGDKGELANAQINDVIRVTFSTTGDGAQIQISNPDDWEAYSSEAGADVESGDNQTFTYTILTATVLEGIKDKGILVRGKNITMTKVELLKASNRYEAIAVTIGEDGIATFSSSKHHTFAAAGITPYYASAAEAGVVTLTPIENKTTWGYQGYVIKGETGTYTIPVVGEAEATYPSGTNYLKGTDDYDRDLTASTDSEFRYIFAKNGSDIGFYYLSSSYTLAAHRAYLQTDTDIRTTDARVALFFDDGETTAIKSVTTSHQDNRYYTLSGMRTTNHSKGIYVVNGKKVIIK